MAGYIFVLTQGQLGNCHSLWQTSTAMRSRRSSVKISKHSR